MLPTVRVFRPDFIVVGSGLDANIVDPLARLTLHSGSFRALTHMMKTLAEEVCGERLALIHEGSYAEAYVPFCGLAIMEALSGERSEAVDPAIDFLKGWQPSTRFDAFVRGVVDDYVTYFQDLSQR